jgi:hypothetical protein
MKNLLTILFFLFAFGTLQAQTVECNSTSLVFQDVVCEDGGTPSPADDYLSFTVTGSNINSDQIVFPMGVNVTVTPGSFSSGILTLSSGSTTYDVDATSPGCAQLDLTVDFTDTSCDSVPVTVGLGAEAIPTMGQWGLMILCLLLTVIGIIKIRSKINQPITA